MKTEFGTFDISTVDGRKQWIQALNRFNDKYTKSPSVSPLINGSISLKKIEEDKSESTGDSSEPSSGALSSLLPLSSESACESAKIEFLIPKIHCRGLKLSDGNSLKTDNQTANSLDKNKIPVSIKFVKTEVEKIESKKDSAKDSCVDTNEVVCERENTEKSHVVMSMDEIKDKLLESEAKNYRRLFIPGRGWVSSKKLQEEVSKLETSGNVCGSTKFSLKDENHTTLDSAKPSTTPTAIILGIATEAQIKAAKAFELNGLSATTPSEADNKMLDVAATKSYTVSGALKRGTVVV